MKENINVAVNEDIKQKAIVIFQRYGLSITEAISLYLQEVIKYNGIPFRVVRSNRQNDK